MKPLSPTKKMSLGLLIFLISLSIPFDLLGSIPILGVFLTLFFSLLTKFQLAFNGYRAGFWRTLFVFFGFMLVEVFISISPSNFLYVVTYYLFNRHTYKKEQKLMQEEAPAKT